MTSPNSPNVGCAARSDGFRACSVFPKLYINTRFIPVESPLLELKELVLWVVLRYHDFQIK